MEKHIYEIKSFGSLVFLIEEDEIGTLLRAKELAYGLEELVIKMHWELRKHVTEWHLGEIWVAIASGILLSDPDSMQTGEWLEEAEARRVMREEVGFDPYPAPEDI